MSKRTPRQEVTFRTAGSWRFLSYFVLVALAALLVYYFASPEMKQSPIWSRVLVAIAGISAAPFFFSELFVVRVVANQTCIIIYDRLNRRKHQIPYSQISAYRPDKEGNWHIFIDKTVCILPNIDIAELHRVMRAMAPKALGAKRWKCGQVPPEEDVLGLCPFDAKYFLPRSMVVVIFTATAILVPRLSAILAYIGVRALPGLYEIRTLFERIDFTKDGLRQRYFFKARFIPWDKITAIFCHRDSRGRSFVVVSRHAVITVPAPVASDLDAMRKFFYSIPDGTPCVNFDENFRKGYRRRKRKGDTAVSATPELAGGSF